MMEKIARQDASPATASRRARPLNQRLRRQALALAVTMALGLPQVQAQAVPDGATHTSTQTAANGVPVVNIAAPNQAGLSHNTYGQFDVGKQGLILNNSGTLSSTQLAGYVTGNPNLSAGQSARLILNEVTSTRASQLAGAMEVAGTPAEVVVANPNGISCTGCGFINTPHAVLTTGRPAFGQDGGLSGFRVTGGTLSVSGDGLDGSLVDQVDLIARAVSINAGVWAKHLNVITGANQVDAASLAAQPIAGTGSAPVVALDVSAIGGMYAGVIRLIGTEAGLGVNNQGQIAAQSGNLSLTSAGDVVLGGKTIATGNLSLQSSGAIEQSGTLAAGGALSLTAAGSLANRGLIQAQGGAITLQAGGALSNAAAGSVQGNGALQLHAASLDNAGKLYALGGAWSAILDGAALNRASGDIYANQGITLSADSLGNDGAIEAAANASLTVAGALANVGHVQSDQGDVTLRADSLDNRGAISAQHAAGVQASSLVQNSGTLVAGRTVGIIADQFSNTATGQLQSGTDLSLSATALDNAGNLYAKGDAVLSGGTLSNAAGAQLIADGSLAVDESGDIVNAGLLQAGNDLHLQHATSLSNAADATIYAGGSFTLGLAQALDNRGLMYGAQSFNLVVGSASNDGILRSGSDLSLDSAGALQNTGAIQAQQDLHLGGDAFTNAGKLYAIDGNLDGQIIGAFDSTASGDIYSGGHVTLTLGSFAHAGVLEAGQGSTIAVQGALDNTGTIQVDQGDLDATAVQLTNDGALSAAGNLSLAGTGELDNQGQAVAGQALTLASASANNSGQTQSGSGTTLAIASFTNSGRVQAGTDLAISGNHDLTNASTGQLLAAGDLGTDTASLLDNAGVLQAGGALSVSGAGAIRNQGSGTLYGGGLTTVHLGGALDNAGTLYGAQGLDLAALSLDNRGSLRSDAALAISVLGDAQSAGTAYAVGDAQWNVSGALVDTGTLAAGGDVDITAASLDGNGTLAAGLMDDGSLGASGNLHVLTTGTLAAHGRALAGNDLVLTGGAIDLSGSQARAGSDITLTALQGDVSNQGGDLAANARLTITAAGALVNGGNSAVLGGHLAAQTLALQAASLDNRYGSLAQSGSDDLALSFVGAFANAHGTLATNAGDLSISAASLDNDDGAIQHAGAGLLTLSTTGALTNVGGSIAGNGAATIHAGGTYGGTGGNLGVAGDLQLDADALDNSGGSLVADHVTLSVGHALTNTGGTLQSTHAMTVHAGSLANTGGFLKATGTDALTLVTSGALVNASSAGAGGFIGGNGDVSIRAASLTNAAQIYAGGALDVTATQGAFINNGGALQALSSLQLDSAGALSNRGGSIEAGAGDTDATLVLHASSLDNTGGRVADSGSGAATFGIGGNLVNQGGTLGGQGAVTLTAASLSNTQGAHLVAGDDLGLTLGGMDNSAGTIYAAGDIHWSNSGASLTNTSGNLGAGGTLALVLGSVGNNSGALAATGDATLQFASLSGNGRVVAGRDLSLTLPGGFTNGAGNTLKANRDLSLHLGGNFANGGGALLSAVRNLTVTAANIDNASGARIDASGTSLTASGTLTNEGRIEGDAITLSANTFTNSATVIGGTIGITANTLTNGIDLGNATDNAAYQSALIAATDGIDLWVRGTLLNRDATIFTLGDLRVGAASNGTRSQAVINRSGDIEADGSVRIDAQQFTNQRRVVNTSNYVLSAGEQAANRSTSASTFDWTTDPIAVDWCAAYGQTSTNGHAQRCGPMGYYGDSGHKTLTEQVTSVQRLTSASAQSRLLANADITLNGSVLNSASTIAAGRNLVVNGSNGNGGGGGTGQEIVQNVAWSPTATVQSTEDRAIDLDYKGSRWYSNREDGLAPAIYWSGSSSSTIALDPSGNNGWISINPGAGLAATMSAGNTVAITAHTIDNTAVGADGQPVHAVIGLGNNVGGQAVGGSGAGPVGSVASGGGAVAGVDLGNAPSKSAGGELGLKNPRDTGIGDTQAATAPQTVSMLPGAHSGVTLPQSGLYTIHTDPGSSYLVETDPRFTQYGQFISSDYMFQQLHVDNQNIEKRLGDGFYEQQQVLDQIASLTGRRFLDDNTDALAQYRDLMNGGAQVAKSFGLSVGVALTADQMANLTQDIVWLVSEKVDGQDVLVPVVYLSAANAKSLAANGATIAGKNVILTASGDITNQGAIKASQSAQLTASNLLNSGAIHAGGNVSIQAAQDILNSGDIHGGGNVSLVAGNDVLSGVNATQRLGTVDLTGLGAPVSTVALTDLRPGSITAEGSLGIAAGRDLSLDTAPVAAGANLSLAAGRDLTATATAISAGGDAQLLAGRDLSLLATAHTGGLSDSSHSTVDTTHTVSTVDAGGNLVLAAGRDLTSQGAQLTAGDQLGVSAGRDVTLDAVTDNQFTGSGEESGRHFVSQTQSDDTLRGTSLSGANGVVVSAGRDLTATAGDISSSAGAVALGAGHDLTLNAGIENHDTSTQTYTKKSGLLSSTTTTTLDTTHQGLAIGTAISGDSVSLGAGHDLTTQGAQLTAIKDIAVSAGHDVLLGAAQDTYSEQHDRSKVKRGGGLGVLVGTSKGDLFTRTHTVQPDSSSDTVAVGSVLSGDHVTVAAGHDLTTQAAQIAGTHDVVLAAGHNLTVGTADNKHSEDHSLKVATYGAQRSGLHGMFGVAKAKQTASETDTTPTGSLIGSTDGAVTLSAGQDVHITGSDVLSQTGTAIVGQNVTIDAAVGTADSHQTQSLHTGGIMAGLTGGAASSAEQAYASGQRAGQVSDKRLKALYAAQAAYGAYDAYRGGSAGAAGAGGAAVGGNVAVDSQGRPIMGADGQPQSAASGSKGAANASGVSLRIGIGASSASAHSDTHDDIAYGSHIQSAGDVTIAATNGDLNVIGSQVSGDNVALAASHDLNLLSQAEQHTQSDHSANARGELGFSIGSQTGFYATADGGKGVAHGNGTTYADTSVTASDTLSLVAGHDANIIGAQAKGNTVLASIGHDLTMESQQTTDDYASHTWQAGGTYVYGSGSEVHASAGMVDSSYKSVDQVSGIGAGDGGFQVHVGGHTDLKGAVIASTADPSLNLLDTGTLSFSDLKNQASYSAVSAGISVGSGKGGTSASPSIGVPQFGDASSTTRAGIAQGTIVTRDNPDIDLSGLDRAPDIDAAGLKPIFDQQKVADQQELGNAAGQVGMRAAGDIASYEANHATTDEEQKSWQDGGANKVLLHGLVGAATAALGGGNGLQGALGAAASEKASGAMANYLVDHHIDPNSSEGRTLMQLGSVAVGVVAGGGSGAATALQGEQFNRQLHPSEQQLAQSLAAKSNGRYTTQQIEDALRLSGYSLGEGSVMPGETSQTGALVNVNDSGSIYDTNASWLLVPGPNDSQYLMQQVPSQVSPDLAAYVIANTGGTTSPYAWAPEQEGLPSHNDGLLAMSDWASDNHVGMRALGGLQMLGGELEIVGGAVTAGTCETGFGCGAAMYLAGAGWDNAMAGANTLGTGQVTATWGEAGLQGLGLSPSSASLIYGATQLVPAGIEAYTLNVAANAQAMANAGARMSYIPIGDFSANGLRVTPEVMQTPQAQAIYNEYILSGSSPDKALLYTKTVLQSGLDLPESISVGSDTHLFKVVPKNVSGSDDITPYSPFFVTEQQYGALMNMSSAEIANYLGLPAEQAIRGSQLGFDVYSMTPKPGANAAAFASDVAPVRQGAYSARGGGHQILVPNRNAWTDPNANKVGEIKGGN